MWAKPLLDMGKMTRHGELDVGEVTGYRHNGTLYEKVFLL